MGQVSSFENPRAMNYQKIAAGCLNFDAEDVRSWTGALALRVSQLFAWGPFVFSELPGKGKTGKRTGAVQELIEVLRARCRCEPGPQLPKTRTPLFQP